MARAGNLACVELVAAARSSLEHGLAWLARSLPSTAWRSTAFRTSQDGGAAVKRIRKTLPVLAAIVATWAVTTATTAQPRVPAFVFVRDAQGHVWFIKGTGERTAIPFYPASDLELAAIPWTGTWLVPSADGSGLTEGPVPDWAVVLPPPLVEDPAPPVPLAPPAPPIPAPPAAPGVKPSGG